MVTPNGTNVEVDLWFQDDAKAAFFEKEINNAGSIILGEHEFAIPTFVEDDRADGEGPQYSLTSVSMIVPMRR